MVKKIVIIIGSVFLIPVVSAVVLYFVCQPVTSVPATVQHDLTLSAVEYMGYRFHVEESGDPAQTLILGLHGGPGNDMESVRPLLQLSDRYHVVLYDQRNSGLSQRGDGEVTVQQMYDDLTFFADHYGGKESRVILVGYSWGAMLASGWAVRNPGRVEKLVLAEPGFLTPEAGMAFMEKSGLFKRGYSITMLSVLVSSLFESLHVKGPDGHERWDYFYLRFVSHPRIKRGDHPLGKYMCEGSAFSVPDKRVGSAISMKMQKMVYDKVSRTCKVDMVGGYTPYAGKTLHIISECNSLIGVGHQTQYHIPLFPDSKVVVIKNAGHLMILEKPYESVSAIREFLEQQ